jgi:hypothetical protein
MLLVCLVCCFLMSLRCSCVIHGLCFSKCLCGIFLCGLMPSSNAEMSAEVACSGSVECMGMFGYGYAYVFVDLFLAFVIL